ncbi:uncharacterized protein METZ01_LOCUS83127, partial [marine metagenome]|tara:strand:- start:444 stop:1193 length:750 start_codon:yes stop_codon:yes gene_type:complete
VKTPAEVASASVLAIIVIAASIWLVIRGGEPDPPPPPPPPPPVVEVEPPPEPDPIVLPSLAASDGFLRAMIEGVSAHPRLGDVIAVDGIARAFVSAVVAIANGESPRALLLYLEPEERFAVAEREGKVVIDPATFERYTWITGVFSSLDATGTAELYSDLEPLFDEAYGEIGYPGERFRNALDDALGVLGSTPLPEGYVEVRRGNVLWEFSDPELENLSPPQKHLLRMGPANVRLIQSKIREIQAAFSH